MLDDLDVLEVLKLGFVGIAFLLAALTFLLLRAEQKVTPYPRDKMIKSISTFMAFSLVLAVGSLFIQTRPDPAEIQAYRTTLTRLDALIDAKVQGELTNPSVPPGLANLARRLQATMKAARDDGLLD